MPSNPARLSIVIPAYNEAARLPVALRALGDARPTIEAAGWEIGEVLVAENGSNDGTAAAASAAGALFALPLRVGHYPKGKAAAVAGAVADVDPSCGTILFADADGATPWETLAAMRPDGRAYIASRHLPASRIVHPAGDSPARELMSRAMRAITRVLFRLPLSDTQCGFKLLPADAARAAFAATASRSYVFDVELLVRLRRARVELIEVPCTWTEVAGSKVSPLRDAVTSLVDLLAIRLRLLVDR